MKNLMAGMLALAALVPAAQVRQEELERGRDALVTAVQDKVKTAADKNRHHAWVSLDGFNLSQKLALQKELQRAGYDFDIPLFGSTYVGW